MPYITRKGLPDIGRYPKQRRDRCENRYLDEGGSRPMARLHGRRARHIRRCASVAQLAERNRERKGRDLTGGHVDARRACQFRQDGARRRIRRSVHLAGRPAKGGRRRDLRNNESASDLCAQTSAHNRTVAAIAGSLRAHGNEEHPHSEQRCTEHGPILHQS